MSPQADDQVVVPDAVQLQWAALVAGVTRKGDRHEVAAGVLVIRAMERLMNVPDEVHEKPKRLVAVAGSS